MYERNFNLLNSKFKEFLLPTLFTSMAGNINIFIDSILVSILIGAINLSVMQIIAPVTTLINLLYWMIGLGGSLVCSIAKAEFNEKGSEEIFTSSIISMVLIGIAILLVSLIFSDSILSILCPSLELRPLAGQFFNIYVIGIPFLCYMMSMSYFIRIDGFLKLPFYALLISNASNLLLDVILIGNLGLGLEGAALATTLSYIIGSLCMSTYFLRKGRTLKFIKVKASKLARHLMDICKSGYSTASTQLYLTIKLYVFNILLTSISGTIGLASFNMCYNTLFIISIFIIGISQSMSPIVSVYFKEMDYNGVGYVIRKSAKLMIIVSLAFVALFALYPQALLYLFKVDNPDYVLYVMNAVRIYSLCYFALGINFLYIFYAQAIQKDKIANIIQILEGLILPISSVVILSYLLGDFGIWISFFVTELITVLFIFAYSRYVNKKTNGEYSGFFINKHNDDEKVFEHSINGNVDEAVNLSKEVQKYLSGNKSAVLVGLAIEEMLVNIININDNVDAIDVIVRDNSDNIMISIKDTGIDFNPVIKNENLDFDNISVLNKIADKIDYSRVLGLNSTVITIKNK